jgi:hypothetical protein
MVNIVGLNFEDAPEEVSVPRSERMFDVGVYECKIESVEILPQKEGSDQNWVNAKVVLGADGYKSKNTFIGIPLNTEGFLRCNGTEKAARFRRAQTSQFLCAILGREELSKEDFGKEIGRLFGKPDKMAGLNIAVEFTHKYKHAYSRYTGARNQFHLITPEGTVFCDEEGSPVVFGTHKSCEDFAKTKEWAYDPFVDATAFSPSASPNDLKRFGGTKTAAANIAGLDEEG